MLIKAGVDISRLNREIRRALPVLNRVIKDYGEEMVITSTFEGNHSPGSLHYCNDAVDIRRPDKRYQEVKGELKDRLGKDYDIVLLSDHIHVEYDTK